MYAATSKGSMAIKSERVTKRVSDRQYVFAPFALTDLLRLKVDKTCFILWRREDGHLWTDQCPVGGGARLGNLCSSATARGARVKATVAARSAAHCVVLEIAVRLTEQGPSTGSRDVAAHRVARRGSATGSAVAGRRAGMQTRCWCVCKWQVSARKMELNTRQAYREARSITGRQGGRSQSPLAHRQDCRRTGLRCAPGPGPHARSAGGGVCSQSHAR